MSKPTTPKPKRHKSGVNTESQLAEIERQEDEQRRRNAEERAARAITKDDRPRR